MENSDKKDVIIASTNFLEKLGIKTIINVLGLRCNLLDVSTLNELEIVLKEIKSTNTFVIIARSFIHEKNRIDIISDLCIGLNLLFICDKIPDSNSVDQFIVNNCDSQEIYDKFHMFFNSNKNTKKNVVADTSMLSTREIDVLKQVARGLSNKEIAEKLYISINTVISHRKNITDKLDIKSISGLTVYALMNNLVKPDEIKL